MVALITSLIDKQDMFEIVRDKVAEILKVELANQYALALADPGKDQTLWAFKVYSERLNPWEQYQTTNPDPTPIINIWYDADAFNKSASSVVTQQATDGVYNIDCYGYGHAENVPAGGHLVGDVIAVDNAQRAARMARNVLMSSFYTQLQLRPNVGRRWLQNRTMFQPGFNGALVQNVVAMRLVLVVTFNEYAPQSTGELLEFISVTVKRKEDGEIVLLADYDHS
jgi:hypothetical protein